MIADVLRTAEEKMEKAVQAQERELSTVRTGRASPTVLANIRADYHGTPTPLNQMANITAPEARMLLIQPWERQMIGAIEKAIQTSDLGINPSNDGVVIRLAFPQLTEDRRRDLVKLVHKHIEDGKVAMRNIRREAQDELKKLEKNKEISTDEQSRAGDQLQKMIDVFSVKLDQLGKTKEADLMEL